MAKPREHNPIAFVGLILAASVLATTIYLNHSHAPSSLHLVNSHDAASTEHIDTAPAFVDVRSR